MLLMAGCSYQLRYDCTIDNARLSELEDLLPPNLAAHRFALVIFFQPSQTLGRCLKATRRKAQSLLNHDKLARVEPSRAFLPPSNQSQTRRHCNRSRILFMNSDSPVPRTAIPVARRPNVQPCILRPDQNPSAGKKAGSETEHLEISGDDMYYHPPQTL